MTAPDRPRISVVILTANRIHLLAETLKTLAKGTRIPDEVVVVLNSPEDGTRESLEGQKHAFPLKMIECPQSGFAEARNRGVAAAAGPFVAFLDDDCDADRWWLERLAAALEDAEAVGGAVLPAEHHEVPPDYSPDLNWLVGLSPPAFFSDLAGRLILPQTANLAFRRDVWERFPFHEVGGRLHGSESRQNYAIGREDAQWWRRLRREGVRCTVEQTAIVWHKIPTERFASEAIASRARHDGAAHWQREEPRADLPEAAADLASLPFRIGRDLLFEESLTQGQAIARHMPWARRQWSLLKSAREAVGQPVSVPERAALLGRAAAGVIASQAKPLLRQPAAFLHHAMKPIPPLPTVDDPPGRLLVVCYDFLGDAVLAMPLLEQLRAALPYTRIELLTGEVAGPLFRSRREIDELTVLPSSLSKRSPDAVRRVWKAVQDSQPDAIVVTYFHGAPPLGLFAATNAPVVCWDRDGGLEQQLWYDLASKRVLKSLRKAEVAALLDLAAPFGIETKITRPTYKPSKKAGRRVDSVLDRLGLKANKFAVIHLDGPDGHWKSWDLERWGEIARRLCDEHGLRVLLAGTRQGRRLAEKLNLPTDVAVSVHGIFDSAELAALLKRARIFLGPDSGPAHLAQAVRTPAVILFGPTEEFRWGPMPRLKSDGETALPFRTVRCAPDDLFDSERRGLPANVQVLAIQPDDVMRAVAELL
ncbi:glycosyltransferase [bacterium]|nr:glycosyltransferase [bacterium]